MPERFDYLTHLMNDNPRIDLCYIHYLTLGGTHSRRTFGEIMKAFNDIVAPHYFRTDVTPNEMVNALRSWKAINPTLRFVSVKPYIDVIDKMTPTHDQ